MSEDFTETTPPPKPKSKLVKIAITLLAIFMVVAFATLLGIYQFVNPFLKETNLSLGDLKNKVLSARNLKKNFEGKQVNFLILGLDKRNDFLEQTVLTDSIILASLNPETNQIKLLPLPRDLWIEKYKSKINALYYFGEEYHGGGTAFATKAISEITGFPISYTLLLDYYKLRDLVNVIDGVDVYVEKGFVDEKYPNPNFVWNSGEEPYITIKFDQGTNHFDGERALEYVRSRNSTDPEIGNDTSRSARQLVLFNALIDKVTSKNVLMDPKKLGRLYNFWKSEVEVNITDEELLAIGMSVQTDKPIDIVSRTIPTSLNSSGELLVHPPIGRAFDNQWVFVPRDPSGKELQDYIHQTLL